MKKQNPNIGRGSTFRDIGMKMLPLGEVQYGRWVLEGAGFSSGVLEMGLFFWCIQFEQPIGVSVDVLQGTYIVLVIIKICCMYEKLIQENIDVTL